jgi:hypothetical protein
MLPGKLPLGPDVLLAQQIFRIEVDCNRKEKEDTITIKVIAKQMDTAELQRIRGVITGHLLASLKFNLDLIKSNAGIMTEMYMPKAMLEELNASMERAAISAEDIEKLQKLLEK